MAAGPIAQMVCRVDLCLYCPRSTSNFVDLGKVRVNRIQEGCF
jgi:hypothetical protein